MSKIRQAPAISFTHWFFLMVLLALLAVVHGLVFAQAGSIELPENARAKSYGSVNVGIERTTGLAQPLGCLQMHT